MLVSPKLGIDGAEWLREALREMEGGKETVCIKTDIEFPDSTVSVKRIRSAYEALAPKWSVPEECGSAEDWNKLFNNAPDSSAFRQFLELKRDGSDDGYLAFVANKTARFADFNHAKIVALLDVQPHDPRFETFYSERKALLKAFSDAAVAEYVTETKIKGENRIHYLTDNTMLERKGVIESLGGRDTIPLDEVARRYPALAEYLRDFAFDDERLTDYFRQYKRQKVVNRIEPDFFDTVCENAQTRAYNLLPTRDGVIDQLDKAKAKLYFVDALGVEFLGFIQARCAILGLRMDVNIVRANLPSITTPYNRKFYDDWLGEKSWTRELDDIKHKEEGGFDYQKTKFPVHLAKELEILGEVLERIKAELALGGSRKAVLASDHGASRLVVVNGQELKYEVDMRGEYSGRCCAECPADGLGTVTVENGWLVLADYGRFKGGRAAAVEVHGGATNEEVIVPVIEMTLMDKKIEIKPVDSVITANYRTTATLVLFSTTELNGVSAVVRGKRYVAERVDANRWRVAMPDIKRTDAYTAEVFEGMNLIGNVGFTVKSGAAKENDLL